MEKPNNFKIPKEFSVLLIHEEDANQLGNKLQYILPPGSDFEDQKLDVLSLQNFDQETDHCVKLISVSNAAPTLPLAEVQYLTMDDDTAIAPFNSKAIKVEIDQDTASVHSFCHDFASKDPNMTTYRDEELVTSNTLIADLRDFVPESDERYNVSKRVEYLDSSSDCQDIKPNVALLDLSLSYELNGNFNNRKLLNGDKHKMTMSNGIRFRNSSQCRKIRNHNKYNESNSMTNHLNVADAVTLVSVKKESSDYYNCDKVPLKECYVKLQPLDILDLEKIIGSKRTNTPNNSQISTTLDADGHDKQDHSLSINSLATMVKTELIDLDDDLALCERDYATKETVSTNHRKRFYKCHHCDEAFTNKANRIQHERTHSRKKLYKCTRCSKKFRNEKKCIKHERTHTGEQLYSCTHCNKKFRRFATFKMHEKIHEQEKPYSCNTCDKKFDTDSKCKRHEEIHTGKRPYSCTYCKRRFRLKTSYVLHERTHTGEKPFSCKHCNKKFTSGSACIVHERIHTGEKPYSCGYCSKAFVSLGDCQRHERFHTGERPFSCRYCSKSFVEKCKCLIHERIHTGEKPYSCKYCSKSFTEKYACTTHERVHTGETPYSCRYCDMKFANSKTRKDHEDVHTGKKPYYCKFCQKSFMVRYLCRRHETVHTKEKPYSCTVCNKAFRHRSSCVQHQRTHTGEKPYLCTYCNKTFSYNSNWRAHMRSHSAEQDV